MADIVELGDRRRPPRRTGIEALQRLVVDDLAAVNRVIVDNMASSVPLIPELAGHIVAAGGKRLRPMLTLASARLVGYQGQRHLGLAAAVEFIHTATLLHDDVVDESNLRRGRATANSVWGNQASVLVGDFLFSRAFQLMVADGSLRVLEVLSNAAATLTEGEVLQLSTVNDTSTSEATYLQVIESKTAVLFSAACRISAIVGERPSGEEGALATYGSNLGIAFQLVDDVLDYSSRDVRLGKSVGDDFAEGKITLPVILAYHRGDGPERDFWKRTLEDVNQQPEDLSRAIALIERHNCLNDCLERARHYAAVASDALGIFPDNDARVALADVAHFCVERAY
ncbi:MAG: polyprenyl synthetase family protein [Alphaproteobacteria bacterium]